MRTLASARTSTPAMRAIRKPLRTWPTWPVLRLPTGLRAHLDSIGMGVDVEALPPNEPHHGDAELAGRLHRQAGGRRDGTDHWNPGHGGLLDDLEAHPSG